ncbi:MAG: homoserine O-succinyltransferase, partial [Kiloniellales bacterium]|nr:homoserine O-succinyltransferase [Kiloniellales bacterium]
MSIILPDGLPARWALKAEGLEAASRREAACGPHQSSHSQRPLRVLLVNLMPDKPATERQIARLLAGTPHAVDLTLAIPDGYRPKTADPAHIWAFYTPWRRLRGEAFDGLIVTGAPVETLAFEEVSYWRELTEIFDWAQDRVRRSLFICWAAQAALGHFHGVPKHGLAEKLSGVFRHRVHHPRHPLLRGFGGDFVVPISRRTEVRAEDLPMGAGLEILASSEEAGLCAVEDRLKGAFYMFDHLEYEADTLAREYLRDLKAGGPVRLPRHYFPADDPARPPVNGWCAYGRLLFGNWLDVIRRETGAAPEAGLWARLAGRWQVP